MAFWNKKSSEDILLKSLTKDNITVEKENDFYSFTLSFGEYSLYPYFNFDGKALSLMINIRECDSKDINGLLERINAFNTKSPYFVAKLKDDVIYLEYNAVADNDTVIDVFKSSIGSLNNLKADIDTL
ncbi:MAG: hypothetical protein K6A63_06670 [Acholeplasmatales bacterium]|nr:hypothetical protein [Acholeplasmatales bacterium]